MKHNKLQLLKFINVPVFVLSLAFGLFLTYITNPPMRTIFVYPTPDNVNDLMFKDKSDNCFSFKANEVDCPDNPDDIEGYTVQ